MANTLSQAIVDHVCDGLPAADQARIRREYPLEKVDEMIVEAVGRYFDRTGVLPWLGAAVDDRIGRGLDDPEEIAPDVSSKHRPTGRKCVTLWST
jgi:hypothetical protein